MQGAIALSFEREPHFFKATHIEGDNHVTILNRSDEDRVVAIGSRSSRPYWFSGEVNQIGYFSQMRISKGFRGSTSRIMSGWEKMYELHQELKDTKSYLVSVLEDNLIARRLLTSGIRKIPIHKELGRLNTYILPLIHKKITNKKYIIRKGTNQDQDLIVSLLQKNYRSKTLAPYWTKESLFHSELDITPENFFITFDRLNPTDPVGCVAVWDQQSFKQIYVHDYERKIKLIRVFLNALKRWTKLPYFPKVGTSFSNAYLSHLALDPKHADALVPMVQFAINENLKKGFHYLSFGFFEWTEFSKIIQKSFRPFTMKSIVYLAYWPEDDPKIDLQPNEDAHIEIAIL